MIYSVYYKVTAGDTARYWGMAASARFPTAASEGDCYGPFSQIITG